MVLMVLRLCAQANVQLCHGASEARGCFTVTWRFEADSVSGLSIPRTDAGEYGCVVREVRRAEGQGYSMTGAINTGTCVPWSLSRTVEGSQLHTNAKV